MQVRAIEGRLQPNFESFDAGIRRFIGWRYDESQSAFVMSEGAETVPVRAEYIQALKQGDLLPADEIASKLSGIPVLR